MTEPYLLYCWRVRSWVWNELHPPCSCGSSTRKERSRRRTRPPAAQPGDGYWVQPFLPDAAASGPLGSTSDAPQARR